MNDSVPAAQAGAERPSRRRALVSLFLVSLFSISFETFLTRYFAVALSSHYSYWIISIAMLGYSVSGVILSLFADFFRQRRGEVSLVAALALIGFTVAAFAVLRANPFNPQEFQNEALWKGQLIYVLLYYVGLFPVFFFAGIFVGLSFLVFYREMGRVYAVDLFGAAAGALGILGLMFLLHPYHLPAAMLAVLFLVFLLAGSGFFGSWRSFAFLAGSFLVLAATAAAGVGIMKVSPLSVPDFKPLHSILGIAGRTVERSVLSPSGFYLVMDDYTERDDLPMTNDYGKLKIGAPPVSYGLYVDAARVAPLLKDRPSDLSYVRGSLSYFPYTIRSRPRVLLVGTNGGFKIIESLRSGARRILAFEERPVLYELVASALRRAEPGLLAGRDVRLVNGSVFSVLRRPGQRYDIIEIASDYLAQGDEAKYAFTREAVGRCLDSLAPGGILSIPVDISELDVYALKVLDTVLAALRARGVEDPAAHLMASRTAWTCQIMVSNAPFSHSDVQALKRYCYRRSFDTPYYPGINPQAVSVWNDLPPISFDSASMSPGSPLPTTAAAPAAQDALMQAMVGILRAPAEPVGDARYFDLSASRLDRPDFYSVSRLSRLPTLLSHVSLLPEQEVGYLLNVFVLAQAVLLGMVVLLIPALVLRRARRASRPQTQPWLFLRTLLYFSFLGLGYLFIELALIQKLTVFLGSATTSFAVTLSAMLVFSGLGSWQSDAARADPRRGLLRTLPVIAAGVLLAAFGLDPLMLAAIGLPMALKLLVAVALIAPFAFALGRPFPLGNTALGNAGASLVPWAWAVNGAFSVVSTPLASILSIAFGWRIVLVAALVLYLATFPVFPLKRAPA